MNRVITELEEVAWNNGVTEARALLNCPSFQFPGINQLSMRMYQPIKQQQRKQPNKDKSNIDLIIKNLEKIERSTLNIVKEYEWKRKVWMEGGVGKHKWFLFYFMFFVWVWRKG